MSWSKPEKTPWGGFKSTKEGDGELFSKELKNGEIDHANHAHFHNDGITLTKEGKKIQIKKPTGRIKPVYFVDRLYHEKSSNIISNQLID